MVRGRISLASVWNGWARSFNYWFQRHHKTTESTWCNDMCANFWSLLVASVQPLVGSLLYFSHIKCRSHLLHLYHRFLWRSGNIKALWRCSLHPFPVQTRKCHICFHGIRTSHYQPTVSINQDLGFHWTSHSGGCQVHLLFLSTKIYWELNWESWDLDSGAALCHLFSA